MEYLFAIRRFSNSFIALPTTIQTKYKCSRFRSTAQKQVVTGGRLLNQLTDNQLLVHFHEHLWCCLDVFLCLSTGPLCPLLPF